ERHLNLRRVLDHMIVGDDEAVFADDEAAALSTRLRLALTPPPLAAARLLVVVVLALTRRLAEEAVEKIVRSASAEEISHLVGRVHLGPDADDHRRLGLRDVAEGLRIERA